MPWSDQQLLAECLSQEKNRRAWLSSIELLMLDPGAQTATGSSSPPCCGLIRRTNFATRLVTADAVYVWDGFEPDDAAAARVRK
jgi:hypothetical protein